MTATEYDNPLVAGFGTATAEEPPFPAQQHLDATDGEKVNAAIDVQEYGSGRIHTLSASGEEVGSGASAEGADLVSDGDYHAKGVTVAHLQDEIDRRNEGREESEQISRDGKKAELIAALEADDEASA